MIESKYSMKYPMPHVVIHIEDNSGYTGPLPTKTAEDPSIYATIVASGLPMGEDGKLVTITDDRVLGAFGIQTVSEADRAKYGQSVAYPSALIDQGAPVRLLRVTPPDATYSFASMLVQWKTDNDGNINVRFKQQSTMPAGLDLVRFANPEKLNAALVRRLNTTVDGWTQRVLINFISAGRGSVYNNMMCAINKVSQARKPTNVKYEFVTVDTRTNLKMERFTASLVNIENTAATSIEACNVVVNHRAEGSSFMVPFVNEAAVSELYTAYRSVLDAVVNPDEITKTVQKTLNVNTFDLIYGRYLYSGSDTGVMLPNYLVSMDNLEIAKLPADQRLEQTSNTYDEASQIGYIYSQKLNAYTYGFEPTATVGVSPKYPFYLGSLYLKENGGSTKPTISMIAGVNQITGDVTSVEFTKIALRDNSEETIPTRTAAASAEITMLFTDGDADGVGSATLTAAIAADLLEANDLVARVSGNTFKLFKVTSVGQATYTLAPYSYALLHMALLAVNTVNPVAAGKLIGFDGTTPAYTSPGMVFIDPADGVVYLNSFDRDSTQASPTGHTTAVIDSTGTTMQKMVFGAAPTKISVVNTQYGKQYDVLQKTGDPAAVESIHRYTVSGSLGSLFRVSPDPTEIPKNLYDDSVGLNPSTEAGGIRAVLGSTGFFDAYDAGTINSIEYKWKYSALLVRAFRGEIDPRIMSPNRCNAKYMFDAGFNTVVGQIILPYVDYSVEEIVNASTIFTEDEKEDLMMDPAVIGNITEYADIDVKQAMYDLMVYRCFQGMPEDKRPVGHGYGMSLYLDSGVTDADTAIKVNSSFETRFDQPNASWDIGGWTDYNGVVHTFTEQIVSNLARFCKQNTINKPYVGKATSILKDDYQSYFPDIDTTDWEMRELLYNSGGNAWIADVNGNLTRRSQRTLLRDADTSDILQESNVRTLSLLCYQLQNYLEDSLLDYNDDGVMKTLSDNVNAKFANWAGNLVETLDITFDRDINVDGGDLFVCYVNTSFRGLILRIPVIVNINRRDS